MAIISDPKIDADNQANGLFKHDVHAVDENHGTSLNPPVEAAPKSDGPATTAKPKFRHQYYQMPDQVVIDIFAKNVPAESVAVQFSEEILVVKIDLPGEDLFDLNLRLFGKIIPSKSRYKILPTKLEISLAKAEALEWASLQSPKGRSVEQKMNMPSAALRPAYSFYKSRADWDKLEAEVKREEEEEKLQGNAGVGQRIRDLYQNQTEDGKKAMNKSCVESNGTVLLTDWEVVSAQKVEVLPFHGLEFKKWES